MPDFRLDCPEIVYRIIVKPGWLDANKKVKPEAYLLLRPRDVPTGLSVRRACLCTVLNCRTKLNSGRGVDSLHVGHVMDLRLEVWQNDRDEEDHAGIIGLPPYFDKDNLSLEEIKRAEDLAGLLVEQSRAQSREAW